MDSERRTAEAEILRRGKSTHYTEKEGLHEAEKQLSIFLSQKLDELIGALEWLKFDQLKKGFQKQLNKIEELSRRVERICNRIEVQHRDKSRSSEDFDTNVPGIDKLSNNYKDLLSLTKDVEKAAYRITQEGALVQNQDIDGIMEILLRLEKSLEQRKSFLKG